jgi:hypothetical protein
VRARRSAAALLLALGALAAPAAPALELGTLFTTPEERVRLDKLRRGEPDSVPAGEAARAPNPTLTGFVKRSDGRNTVWIDGTPVPVSRPGSGALLDPRAVGARPPDEAIRIERKPARESSEVRERR